MRASGEERDGTNGLHVDRGEQVLEDSRHELELLVLASESAENELRVNNKSATTPRGGGKQKNTPEAPLQTPDQYS